MALSPKQAWGYPLQCGIHHPKGCIISGQLIHVVPQQPPTFSVTLDSFHHWDHSFDFFLGEVHDFLHCFLRGRLHKPLEVTRHFLLLCLFLFLRTAAAIFVIFLILVRLLFLLRLRIVRICKGWFRLRPTVVFIIVSPAEDVLGVCTGQMIFARSPSITSCFVLLPDTDLLGCPG